MASTAIILAVAAAALLAFSVALIWWKDHGRRWDHLARSAVQISVASASVGLALFLLQKQFAEQDARLFRQQATVALSIVRTTTLSIHLDTQAFEPLYTYTLEIDCAKHEECEMSEAVKAKYNQAYGFLQDWILGDQEYKLIVSDPTYRDHLLQMLRNSFIFSDYASRYLLAAIHNFEAAAKEMHAGLKRVRATTTPLFKRDDDGYPPPKEVAEQFLWVARIQASSLRNAAAFLCNLYEFETRLKSQTFVDAGVPLTIDTPEWGSDNKLCEHSAVAPLLPAANWDWQVVPPAAPEAPKQ